MVSATGQFLQVYPPLANGGFNTGALQNLNLNTAQSAPVPTTTGTAILNLPSNDPAIAVAVQSDQYRDLQPVDLDDGVRLARQLLSGDLLFHANRDPGAVEREHDHQRHPGRRHRRSVTFNNTGGLATPATGNLTFAGFNPTDGAAPMSVTFNFSKTTQYGTQFGVSSITQNGYTTGQLSTVSVDPDGVVSAVYTNGRSTQLGQLAIANFPNAQGLQQLSDTDWAQTFSSGTVVQGTAGSAGFGTVQAGALESSNVDLTTELVNMITEQRAFQANAQVITTADQLSQTVISIATNG